LIAQPTGPSLADLKPAVNEFHSLIKAGIPKEKLIFVLNHIATKSEEESAREYLRLSGYKILDNFLYERSSFRAVQNEGKSITEVIYKSLASQGKKVIEELVDNISAIS
jgi:chromosome partitioning protein